jgi:polyhydroxyalkanoate synthase
MLKPWRLFAQKYVGMVDILDDRQAMEDFLRMEKWIFDSPDQAGEMLRQFVNQFYKGNGFVKGGIRVGTQAPTLKDVTMPVLNIYALQDHLVPPDASRALKDLVGTKDYSELAFRGGHIGIYVSSRAQHEVPTAMCDWLARR